MKSLSIILGLGLVGTLLFTSCEKQGLCVKGEGTQVTRTLNVGAFNEIDFQEAGTVIISQGSEQKVEVTSQQNIIDRIQTDVSGSRWDIEFENGCYKDYDLTVNITVPFIKVAALSGAGSITLGDLTTQSSLELILSGSGDIYMNDFSEGTNFKSIISGSGSIVGNGVVSPFNNLEVIISGSGNYKGYQIPAENGSVLISGSGNVETNLTTKADFKISGSGNIYYKGSPGVSTSISGSGNVVHID